MDLFFKRCCNGYAHGEVIRPGRDIELEGGTFDPSVSFPVAHFDLETTTVPKKWDIHITACTESLDPRLEKLLFDVAGMYYIDVRKADERVHRVFTVLGTNSKKEGTVLFESLRDYLIAAGGMNGAIKFEDTCYWNVFGAPGIIPATIR